MCEPMTLAMVGLNVLKMGAEFMGQQQAANAQESYQQRLFNDRQQLIHNTAVEANQDFLRKSEQENRRLIEEEAVASQDAQQLAIDRAEAVGTATASSQVASMSLDALYADFFRQEARFRDSITQNLEFDRKQAQANKEGFRAEAISRVTGIPPITPAPIDRPSPFGLLLNLAGTAFDGYRTYQRSLPPPTTKKGG